MVAKPLVMQFTLNYQVFRRNAAGITAAESLVSPSPGGNCLNWVLGHVVASREGVLRFLGEAPVWDAEAANRYRRGSEPVTSVQEAETWENLQRLFDLSQERLVGALARLDAAALAAAPPEGRNLFGSENLHELLAGAAFHESYHVGQSGLLRRLLGKEGAIK